LEIGYQAHSQTDDLVFSQVSLDIDGATLGTTGTGFVQLLADLFPEETPQLPSLEVFDDGDGAQMLVDSVSFLPGQKGLRLATTVKVGGGSDSNSGAVLTDFQFAFLRAQSVPEPGSLLLATMACLAWPLLSLKKNRCRP